MEHKGSELIFSGQSGWNIKLTTHPSRAEVHRMYADLYSSQTSSVAEEEHFSVVENSVHLCWENQ